MVVTLNALALKINLQNNVCKVELLKGGLIMGGYYCISLWPQTYTVLGGCWILGDRQTMSYIEEMKRTPLEIRHG